MKNEWFGIDASLEESLCEYGFLFCKNEHCAANEFFVVFKQGDLYGHSYINEPELNTLIDGKEWATKERVKGFLSFVGCTAKEWKAQNIANKVFDVCQYWGIDNFFTDYYPQTLEQVKQNFEIEF